MKPLALLVVLAVLFGAGCKKKPKPPVDDGTGGQNTSSPNSGGGGTGGGGTDPTIVPSAGAGGGVVINTGGVGGGGGGGGAAMAVRKAVRRAGAQNEMAQLGIIIEDLRTPEGRMPTKEQIMAALRNPQYKNILDAVEQGSFVLTGTTEGGGLWALEVDSEKIGGFVLVGGKAVRANSDEVNQYLSAFPPNVRQQLTTPQGQAAQPKQNTQPMPMPQPKVVAPAPNISKQDMEDIRIFIDNASGASGQMPSPQQVYGVLAQAQSPVAAHVKSGAVVINQARTRDEVWAYEAKALQQGGWMVTANGVEQVGAADLKRRLGR